MTATTEEITEQLTDALAAHRLTTPQQCTCGWRDNADLTGHATHTATHLEPLVTQLLADATAHGFRQGFQAGRTLTRQRGMT